MLLWRKRRMESDFRLSAVMWGIILVKDFNHSLLFYIFFWPICSLLQPWQHHSMVTSGFFTGLHSTRRQRTAEWPLQIALQIHIPHLHLQLDIGNNKLTFWGSFIVCKTEMAAKVMCPSNKHISGIHRQMQLLNWAAVFKNLILNKKIMAFLADATDVNLVECSSYSSKVN